MRIIIPLLLLILSFKSYSQSNQTYRIIENYEVNRSTGKINNIDYSEVLGSPYWNENFSPSILFLNDDQQVTKIKLRYNIFTDDFEIKQRGKIFNIKKDKNLKKIQINDVFFSLIEIDKFQKNTIAEILYDNKLKLFLKHQAYFLKAELAKGYTEPKPNRFEIPNPKLYLKTPFNRSLIRIKKIKDFAKIFPRSSSKIKKFIKENKIKIDNKEQLIQLVRYIEEIA